MKIYLVGGAVRDKLLKRAVKERDYVVVGATTAELIKKGFKQVGKGFPVFLHPKTHAEYALARTERKTGKGYTAFSCVSDPTITLEEDLKRRDLTINAMAMTQSGKLIDPYGGKQDLENKILRYVSEAFAEDPLRVLRVARFAARFPDFTIAPATAKLMRNIVKAGEMEHLVIERVWLEMERALQEPAPWRFFEVLQNCGAAKILLPELPLKKALVNLQLAVTANANPVTLFATLGANLSENKAKALTKKLKPPRLYHELLLLLIKQRRAISKGKNLSAKKALEVLSRTDSLRKPERFQELLLAHAAAFPQKDAMIYRFWVDAYKAAAQVNIKTLLKKNLAPEEFKKALYELRLAKIANMV